MISEGSTAGECESITNYELRSQLRITNYELRSQFRIANYELRIIIWAYPKNIRWILKELILIILRNRLSNLQLTINN